MIVPSKFYSVAAAGRPTIFIGAVNGEIARLIEEAECGFVVDAGDAKALVQRILELVESPDLCTRMGKRARKAFERNWEKSLAIAKWEQLLSAAELQRKQ